ncbi:MAG: Uracil-DNA glycosylase [Candidatus Giovannonibacteria bacterium GW2011_GWC2_44_8]|uniref:Type-4 uracil-DNA glycosylase n=1 Tax=Candidatus Giovannonibacteria bacterium GW2011_GWC2_44_8 TaxID=1618657 RepID=A0A0G1MCR7_9BACT|nr:MAG: Uracil-DNA glycosylase [Candidatus Giovannonibacteria bacterium GW2011_GWC2_44_8]
MDKLAQLKKLEQEIIGDTTLPLQESNLVFGEGNIDCQVMFIGEAPGLTENELRRPFVGRAGKLLDKMIQEIGWQRKDVYITNIVKRRPPENRDPLPEEIEAYKPYLARQIEIIAPKIIAPLGRFSMNYFLPFAKISNAHGKVFDLDERLIVPLYHPAAALRATTMFNDLRSDFKKLPEILKTPPVPKLEKSPKKEEDNDKQESLF